MCSKLEKMLEEALIDEYKAGHKEYPRIKNKLKLKNDKRKIKGIIRDEKRHYRIIRKIKSRQYFKRKRRW